MGEDGDDDDGDGDDDARSAAAAKPLTAHGRQQERMREKLTKLEEQQLAEKPWQLKGEVGASKRPTNSLLEADLDFDQGSKAAPVITEEVRGHAPARALARRAPDLPPTHARAQPARGKL